MAEARVLGFAEALEVVLKHAGGVGVPGVDKIRLPESRGRVLAEKVKADRDQPPFDRSTRDGFAVRAEEWSAGARLKVAGQVRAGGELSRGTMRPGTAIEIMTGAAVPRGADAVVMLEHVDQGEGQVWATGGRKLRAGENIVERGSQARRGEVVVGPGTRMGAAEIALAAACGYAELAVYRRPRVAIVATGDELVELRETPGAHQIYNSNGYALEALVAASGGQGLRLGIARDVRKDVRARISAGRKRDLLLLSGGVSAGKYDLVEDVLAEFGAEFFFTGVKMQPGKPVVFGRMPKGSSGTLPNVSKARRGAPTSAEWTYFFGLPGNPISTQVTFHCFVEPLLEAICGAAVAEPKFVQATLTEEIEGKAGLTRILPAVVRHDLVRPEVRLVDWQGSGDLAANARANCYAVLPDGQALRAGDVITVLLR